MKSGKGDVLRIERSFGQVINKKFFAIISVLLLLLVATFAFLLFSKPNTQANAAYDPTKFYATDIASGNQFNCAIALNGQVYCWGYNGSGQLGNGITSDSPIPVAVDTSGVLAGKSVKQISAAGSTACAVASDNKVYCWGNNQYGQLGNGLSGIANSSSVPVAVDMSGALDDKTVLQVAVGVSTVCAIASDNQAYCWGYNAYGQLGNGVTGTNSSVPVAVLVGAYSGKTLNQVKMNGHTACVVASDNNAYCWGYNSYGQLGRNLAGNSATSAAVYTSGALLGKTIVQLSDGIDQHVCAIASDGKPYCWGNGTNGQLGNSSNAVTNLAPVVTTTSGALSGKLLAQISTGTSHTCAVSTDGKAYCWGSGGMGRLGNGSTTDTNVPVVVDTTGVLSGKLVSKVSSGGNHTCAIATDGQVLCWGYNFYGQLGNNNSGSTANSSVPVAVSAYKFKVAQDVYRVFDNANSLTPGSSLAADNTAAQLAQNPVGDAVDFRVRASVANTGTIATGFREVSTGENHSCGIALSNQAYCWGNNNYGQLGKAGTYSNTPTAVDDSGVLSGKAVTQISAGSYYACTVASDNQAYCWGNNGYGQLGIGSTGSSYDTPMAVVNTGLLNGKTIKQISAGSNHTCVIASDNNAYCWGQNNNGQLGNNTTNNSDVPVAVVTTGALTGKTIKQISAGGANTCVIASDNNVYCWGNNANGQLGNGTSGAGTNSSVPVAVNATGAFAGKTVKQISSGYLYACAIASDNNAYCWGGSFYGQLGNGASGAGTNSSVPVAVSVSGALAGKTIKQIRANASSSPNTCAIASDNNAYCWGNNNFGQLGNNTSGTPNQSSVPVAVVATGVLDGKTVTQVTEGGANTCAIASDNQAYCWGFNGAGQLGDGTATNSSVPVEVVNTNLTPSHEPSIPSGTPYKLQYAKRTETTCALQNTNQSASFADVTTTSTIRWKTNAGVTNNTILTNGNTANDPASIYPYIYQTYRDQNTFATIADITASNAGLFDFSLSDYNADADNNYCFRIVNAGDSSRLDIYNNFPEIRTPAAQLGVVFVDNNSAVVTAPNVPFPTKTAQTACQTSNAILGVASQKIRVINSTTNSKWNLSIAASTGPTAKWQSGALNYSFNDASSAGCQTGQLSITPGASTITPRAEYSSTGLTRGSTSSYANGTLDSITLLTAGATADAGGSYWDLTGIGLDQKIPASAAPGSYAIDMTLTLVAE